MSGDKSNVLPPATFNNAFTNKSVLGRLMFRQNVSDVACIIRTVWAAAAAAVDFQNKWHATYQLWPYVAPATNSARLLWNDI